MGVTQKVDWLADIKTIPKMQPVSNYDTNSLRLITPRLCTYNVNVNRPYKYNNNINRMFITDMTYMPGYFIEQIPHKYYKNKKIDQTIGNTPIRVDAPSLRLKKGQYKRPLCMYDLDEIDEAKMKQKIPVRKPYEIFPPSNTKKGVQPSLIGEVDRHRWNVKQDDEDEPDEAEPGFTRKKNSNCISGKQWDMDRFKMWSGGTEGSVEFPKWNSLRGNSAAS